LKYCERCGGLFLRRVGDLEVYCVPCAPAVREMASPRKPAGRAPGHHSTRHLGGVACA